MPKRNNEIEACLACGGSVAIIKGRWRHVLDDGKVSAETRSIDRGHTPEPESYSQVLPVFVIRKNVRTQIGRAHRGYFAKGEIVLEVTLDAIPVNGRLFVQLKPSD